MFFKTLNYKIKYIYIIIIKGYLSHVTFALRKTWKKTLIFKVKLLEIHEPFFNAYVRNVNDP